MKIAVKIVFFLVVFSVISACSKRNKEAELYVKGIEELYNSGGYEEAKLKIDSIQILYPKAFDQIKEGMSLLQQVRRAQDMEQIAYCDSTIAALQVQADSMKQYFKYDINKEYEDVGRYLPNGSSNPLLTKTTLRSGVSENGHLYLESVYIGGQFHEMVRVGTKDGLFVETMPVTGDGLNFRFRDMGQQYEIVKFTNEDAKNVAAFIFDNEDNAITATLKGKNTMTFTLSKIEKKSISDSYILSSIMMVQDSLNDLREISRKRIEYLDGKIKPGEEIIEE